MSRNIILALALSPLMAAGAGCYENALNAEGIPGFDSLESVYWTDVEVTEAGAPLWQDQQLILSNIPDLGPYLPALYRIYTVWLGPPVGDTPQERCALYRDVFNDAAGTLDPIAEEGNTVFFASFNTEEEPTELVTGGYAADGPLWIVGGTFHGNSFAAIDRTWDMDACVDAYTDDGDEAPDDEPDDGLYPWFSHDAVDGARSWWLGVQDEVGYLTLDVDPGALEGHLTGYSLSETNTDLETVNTGVIHDATFWGLEMKVLTDMAVR